MCYIKLCSTNTGGEIMKDKNGKEVSMKSFGCALIMLGGFFLFIALIMGILFGSC